MNQENIFRALLGVGFLAVLAIALPHRLKSWASKERLDRRQCHSQRVTTEEANLFSAGKPVFCRR